jgi:hypothetical protein
MTRLRVRYRLSVAGGLAMQDVNGAYLSLEDHEATLTEAARLIRMATSRYPLALTPTQCRDAHRWLAEQA